MLVLQGSVANDRQSEAFATLGGHFFHKQRRLNLYYQHFSAPLGLQSCKRFSIPSRGRSVSYRTSYETREFVALKGCKTTFRATSRLSKCRAFLIALQRRPHIVPLIASRGLDAGYVEIRSCRKFLRPCFYEKRL